MAFLAANVACSCTGMPGSNVRRNGIITVLLHIVHALLPACKDHARGTGRSRRSGPRKSGSVRLSPERVAGLYPLVSKDCCPTSGRSTYSCEARANVIQKTIALLCQHRQVNMPVRPRVVEVARLIRVNRIHAAV